MPFTGVPYTFIPDPMVKVDAPDSTTLRHYQRDNSNYLKSAIGDGANASQDINTNYLTVRSNLVVVGDTTLNGGSVNGSGPTLDFEPAISFNGGATFDTDVTLVQIDLGLLMPMIRAEGF
jgi:hypothetical protein